VHLNELVVLTRVNKFFMIQVIFLNVFTNIQFISALKIRSYNNPSESSKLSLEIPCKGYSFTLKLKEALKSDWSTYLGIQNGPRFLHKLCNIRIGFPTEIDNLQATNKVFSKERKPLSSLIFLGMFGIHAGVKKFKHRKHDQKDSAVETAIYYECQGKPEKAFIQGLTDTPQEGILKVALLKDCLIKSLGNFLKSTDVKRTAELEKIEDITVSDSNDITQIMYPCPSPFEGGIVQGFIQTYSSIEYFADSDLLKVSCY
jgi:hypothetical protein